MHIWNVPSGLNLRGPKPSCDLNKWDWDSSAGRTKDRRNRAATTNETTTKAYDQGILSRTSTILRTILHGYLCRELCSTTSSGPASQWTAVISIPSAPGF